RTARLPPERQPGGRRGGDRDGDGAALAWSSGVRARRPDGPASVSGGARVRFRAGVRAGLPLAVAVAAMGISFGPVAQAAGLSPVAAIAMSATVFAASAQFAAIAILAAGGGVAAAVAAVALMNSRFLTMGAAVAPS